VKKVLVVDDEPAIAHLVRASLKAAGLQCRVEYCSDGAQGRRKATEDHYDLITLDRNMPRASGIDALRAIMRDPRSAGIPVVMITAQADRGFERHALELGASAVLSKPFRPHQLANALRQILQPEQNEAEAAPGGGEPPE
jgi:CheY-like chemotaxis protein